MRVVVDTNIFLSLILDRGKSDISQKLLNGSSYELGTSFLNLLEIRTVLTKRKGNPQSKVEDIIEWLRETLDFIIDDIPNSSNIIRHQKNTLLEPMDCMIMQSAKDAGAVPVTLDGEMKHHNAVDPKYIV